MVVPATANLPVSLTAPEAVTKKLRLTVVAPKLVAAAAVVKSLVAPLTVPFTVRLFTAVRAAVPLVVKLSVKSFASFKDVTPPVKETAPVKSLVAWVSVIALAPAVKLEAASASMAPV